MTEFLKRYWFGIVGILIGCLGVFYSVQKSKYEREPIFLLDSVRTEIINKQIISETSVRVIKSDGTEVTNDLTALRFYFWNDGKKPIKKEDILEPLFLQLSDSSSEIIDYRVLKLSRDVTGFQLSRDKLKEKNVLSIDFRILEKDDGITGQIIYSGNPNSMLLMKGTIEGVKVVGTKIQVQKKYLFLMG